MRHRSVWENRLVVSVGGWWSAHQKTPVCAHSPASLAPAQQPRATSSVAGLPSSRIRSRVELAQYRYASGMPFPFRPRKYSHNLQIPEIIDAIAQTEPDLFGEGNAVLMPVTHSTRLTLADDMQPRFETLTYPHKHK